MKINHAIKKIAAVGTGAMLLGVSAAAVSADLSDYPAPFIQDGVFSGTLVLGESAATTDVLGSIEIVASLQAAATSPVSGEGSGSESVLEDSVRIASGSTNLALGQPLSGVKTTLTGDDLDMLADVVFEDDSNNDYDAEFRIRLPTAAVEWTDDRDITNRGDPVFAVMFDSSETWDFEMYFPDALNLDDFRGEAMDLLGQEFRVSNDVAETSNADGVLTLFRSGTSVSIEAGETRSVVYEGDDVEITVIDGNSDDGYAIIAVNGKSERVNENEYVTVNGVRLYVDDVFISNVVSNNVIVNFFVGAEKLTFQHGEAVEDANEDDIEGTVVLFNNLAAGDAWVDAPITKIAVRYTPGDHEVEYSEDVNEDHQGLKLGDEYVDPVFGQIKFAFTDVVPGATSAVKELIEFVGTDDNEMSLTVDNYNGVEYDLVLLFGGATPAFAYDDQVEEHYVLGSNFDATGVGSAHVQLFEDNRFIVRDGEYTRVLQVMDIDATANEIELRDLGSGETRTWSAPDTYDEATADIDGVIGGGNTYAAGSFIYDDEIEFVLVPNAGTPYIVLADLATGAAVAAESTLVTSNGAIIDLLHTAPAGLDWTDGSYTPGQSVVVGLQEESDYNNDDGPEADIVLITIEHTAVPLSDDHHFTFAALDTADGVSNTGEVALESNDDIHTFKTFYGTYAQRNTDAESPELEIYYPSEQVYYNVFVGPESAGTSIGGSEGSVVGEVVNPIQVGSAILDTEAAGLVGNENLLVIGGPCVNSVAAELLDNPASCTEGFTQGSAMLKLWSNNDGTVSLLVAGYDGADTRLASRVLANYAEYEGQLVGDEVVVSGTSINNVDISAPVVTEDDSE